MTKEHLEQIEIRGVKMLIDLRQATRVEEIRVGSRVKVLRKTYSDAHEVLHGIVIGFEPFKVLPTIIIAVAKIDYSEAKVEFVYYNTKTEGVEVVVAHDDDVAALDKNDFLKRVDRDIQKKQLEIQELEQRKQFFLDKFQCYWKAVEEAVVDATS